jgi:uncharacterized membrane protein YoaT (DUF817 family)
VALVAVAYVNFFSHHFVADARLGLSLLAAAMFGHCRIHFRVWREHRWMPLLLGLLVASFIWFAENIGTCANAWLYPGQRAGWRMVSSAKLGSWFLLGILSRGLVLAVHRATALAPPDEGRGWNPSGSRAF